MGQPEGHDIDTGSIHETQFGETPINEDEREHLRPEYRHIQTRDEQNRAEVRNITRGLLWLNRQPSLDKDTLLTQTFLRTLHSEMFGTVWTWAGKPRTRETTIGIDPAHITEQWEQLLGNVRYWIECQRPVRSARWRSVEPRAGGPCEPRGGGQ